MSTTDASSADLIARLATDIVVAYAPVSSITANQLPELVRQVRLALTEDIGRPAVGREQTTAAAVPALELPSAAHAAPNVAPRPAISVEESVRDDYLISLEDGKPYRSLRRHLMTRYAMTPEQYRQKWGLPNDYPMVAPSYARERSEVAKRIGLGRSSPRQGAVSRLRAKAK